MIRRWSSHGTAAAGIGCLPRGPRFIVGSGAGSQFVKIVQNPGVILILSEELAFRQVFTDGRALPREPNPTFMGYSVGRWDGDVLVVESRGFNDRTWLDYGGHRHTEALHVTERFHRTSVGTMDLHVTMSDPALHTRSWSVPMAVTLAPDTEILEYVCNENETRRTAIGARAAEKSLVVAESLLAEYAGTYDVMTTASLVPVTTLTVRARGNELLLDIDGRGNIPLVPVSKTTFSARLIELEFGRDDAGVVAVATNIRSGARFRKRPR